jgi:hypothetical protein
MLENMIWKLYGDIAWTQWGKNSLKPKHDTQKNMQMLSWNEKKHVQNKHNVTF